MVLYHIGISSVGLHGTFNHAPTLLQPPRPIRPRGINSRKANPNSTAAMPRRNNTANGVWPHELHPAIQPEPPRTRQGMQQASAYSSLPFLHSCLNRVERCRLPRRQASLWGQAPLHFGDRPHETPILQGFDEICPRPIHPRSSASNCRAFSRKVPRNLPRPFLVVKHVQ